MWCDKLSCPFCAVCHGQSICSNLFWVAGGQRSLASAFRYIAAVWALLLTDLPIISGIMTLMQFAMEQFKLLSCRFVCVSLYHYSCWAS